MTPATPDLPSELRHVLAHATRRETPCGDGQMVWHEWGGGEQGRAPLVLLHGGAGSWTHWLRNALPLAGSGRRVLAPDLPGFGDSARPPWGSDADALPEPVQAGLQSLVGDAACDMVGFSFGGMVAGFIAAQFPAQVRHLVIVGASGLGVAPLQPVRLMGWRQLPDRASRESVHRVNLAALMLHRPESVDALAVQLQAYNVERERLLRRRIARTDALARALALTRCPVHGIYGGEDALYRGQLNRVEQALRLAPGFAGLHVMAGAGHWAPYECAGEFNTLLPGLLDTPPA